MPILNSGPGGETAVIVGSLEELVHRAVAVREDRLELAAHEERPRQAAQGSQGQQVAYVVADDGAIVAVFAVRWVWRWNVSRCQTGR